MDILGIKLWTSEELLIADDAESFDIILKMYLPDKRSDKRMTMMKHAICKHPIYVDTEVIDIMNNINEMFELDDSVSNKVSDILGLEWKSGIKVIKIMDDVVIHISDIMNVEFVVYDMNL